MRDGTLQNVLDQESDWQAQLRAALDKAVPNVLRMSLYHLTRDPSLLDMELAYKNERGGVYRSVTLHEKHHQEVRDRMFALLCNGPISPPPPPSYEDQRRMMEIFAGGPLNDSVADYCFEELGLASTPRQAQWTNRPPAEVLENFQVAIIGAGISGVTAAMQMQHLGVPFTVYERQAAVGGTWQLNDYPEARVDVSSLVYQYVFEPGYPWPDYYSPGSANNLYMKQIVDKYNLWPDMRFGVELKEAIWDEAKQKWKLLLEPVDGGSAIETEANVIISAAGLFSTPNYAEIPGMENFAGKVVHTTSWDHGFDISGKRVALIGTGSSGTQLAERISAKTASFTIYQRTASWFSGISNYRDPMPKEVHWLFSNVPYYWNWLSYADRQAMLAMQEFQKLDPEWIAQGGRVSELNDNFREALTEYIKTRLPDRPDLVAKCVPDYAPLGRRMVVDNGWFDTLLRDNVELVTDGIDRIEAEGIVANDGTLRPTDLIILGSGFKVAEYMWPVKYTGRDGVTLEHAWKDDGARAYLGLVMPDFPNLFAFYGPNGQPRSGSMHSWAENWSRYAGTAIVEMLERGATSVECRREVFENYNRDLDKECKNLLWEAEGKGSYLVNKFGRVGPNVPWTVDIYYSWIKKINPGDFNFRCR